MPNIEQAAETGEEEISLPEGSSFAGMLIPFLLAVYFLLAFIQLRSSSTDSISPSGQISDALSSKYPKINFLALLTKDEFSSNLRDTVYTDKDLYLEMRIDEQALYVHYKNGHIKEYPISSGNKYLNKGIESRSGLFAIFLKEELHLSSQFNDAKMFYYMPFNMGIGFHGLAGTGYYGNLGIRPSSHGCIRMRTNDAKELFKQCEVGTLVLSHRGNTARVVAFAPEGFSNQKEYSKEDYMNLMAYNLNSIYEGKFFINPPQRFIVDPSIIPRIGINIGKEEDIPESQQVPVFIRQTFEVSDVVRIKEAKIFEVASELDPEIAETLALNSENEEEYIQPVVESSPELVKRLVYNPVGILPYFPPNK